MRELTYKKYSRCNLAAAFVALLYVWIDVSNGIQIMRHFNGTDGLYFYVTIMFLLPSVLLLTMAVMVFIKKPSPKVLLSVFIAYYGVAFVGLLQYISIRSDGTAKIGWQLPITGVFVLKLLSLFMALIFSLLVLNCHVKASVGALVITISKGLLFFISFVTVSTLISATLEAAFPLFLLLSLNDYAEEKREQRDITQEKITFSKRNITRKVIISVITLGIGGIVWLSQLCKDIRHLHGEEGSVSSEVVLVILVPFYAWYWGYTRGKQMYEDSKKRGGNLKDYSKMYLIFNILGLQLFTMGFMQSQLNQYK